MRFRSSVTVLIIATAFGLGLDATSPPAKEVQKLGKYSIQSDRIFVAGMSSGGAMAVQLQVAYSQTFKGAAIYAGLPYYCAQDNFRGVAACSLVPTPIDVAALVSVTRSWAQQGLIDPMQNLRGQPVYLWSGLLDTVVNQAAVNALESYYRNLGVNVFQYDNNFLAEHGWESPDGPILCGILSSPFITVCSQQNELPFSLDWPFRVYDSQQVWLSRLIGPLKPRNDRTLEGSVLPFDQNEFASGRAATISMADTGYVFVPKSCANGTACGLVLALHGCFQHFGAIGRAFVDESGINEWADTNNIVVLYPQTIASSDNRGTGCWDWWGYLNEPDYAQKSGAQMKAVYGMVVRAAGVRNAGF